jgi:hypothetical protein
MLTFVDVLPHIEALLPGFHGMIEGATPEQIRALEEVVEHPLPEPYVEFLRVMGNDPGPILRLKAGMDTRVATLMEYYREIGWRPPERFTLIGRHPGLAVSTFLDAQQDPPYAVVGFDIPLRASQQEPWTRADRYAASLPEYVMSSAFAMVAAVRFRLDGYVTLPPVPGLLERLDAGLLAAGYERHPLTGGLSGMYWRGDVAAATTFHGDPQDIGLLYVHSDDGAEIERVVTRLRTSLVLELHDIAETATRRPWVIPLREELLGAEEATDDVEDDGLAELDAEAEAFLASSASSAEPQDEDEAEE